MSSVLDRMLNPIDAEQTTEPRAAQPPVPDARQGPKTWTLAELLAAEFPEPRWIVPSLLPAGLAILGGRPKQGKSFMALQLSLAVASGGMFLDRRMEQGKALYIALEDSPRRLQKRLADMGASAGNLAMRFEIAPLNTSQGVALLGNLIRNNGLSLVVIDTLARSIRGRVDWDNMGAVTPFMSDLQRLALDNDCCVLLVDHHRKGGALDADVIDDIAGSTAKSAVADTILGIYRKRGEKGATLAITGRDVEQQTLGIMFSPLTCCWQLDETADGVRAGTVQDGILRELYRVGGKATTSALGDALGMPAGNVSRELHELVAKGVVVKGEREGREIPYRLFSTIDKHDKGDKRQPLSCLSPLSSNGIQDDDNLSDVERFYRELADEDGTP